MKNHKLFILPIGLALLYITSFSISADTSTLSLEASSKIDFTIWWMMFLIFIAGALGGVVNAFISDNGFLLPKREITKTKATIIRPGYLGNTFIGGIAAIVSWGLYGPLSAIFIVGTTEALTQNNEIDDVGLTLASFVGALLVGIGGARWLSNEVDKSLLRAATIEAAAGNSSKEATTQIATAKPSEALNIAKSMNQGK